MPSGRSTAAPAARTRSRFGRPVAEHDQVAARRAARVRRARRSRRSPGAVQGCVAAPRSGRARPVGRRPRRGPPGPRESAGPDQERPLAGQHAVVGRPREDEPRAHHAGAIRAADRRHPLVDPVAATTDPARIDHSASSSIAVTTPSYQPTAVAPSEQPDTRSRRIARRPATASTIATSGPPAAAVSAAATPARPPPTTSTTARSRAIRAVAAAVGRPAAAGPGRRTRGSRRDTACAARVVAGTGGGRTSAGSSAPRGRASRRGRGRPTARRARSARPARRARGTWHARTLGRPSTSHSHQPHWPVSHIRPRGRWKRKLRDRIGRPAASSATASGSPSGAEYRPPVERERRRWPVPV